MIPEAEFSHQHNVPRAKLKQWRTEGALAQGEHWVKEGNLFVITPQGEARIAEILKLTPLEPEPVVAPVIVRITGRGASSRILRGRVILPGGELGDLASVMILYPKATAQQFRLGTEIQVLPTDTEGIYAHEEKPAPRIRI